jgi:hypothetical protein
MESTLWLELLSMVISTFDLRFANNVALEKVESIPGDWFTSINPVLELGGGQMAVLPSLSNWSCSVGAWLIE